MKELSLALCIVLIILALVVFPALMIAFFVCLKKNKKVKGLIISMLVCSGLFFPIFITSVVVYPSEPDSSSSDTSSTNSADSSTNNSSEAGNENYIVGSEIGGNIPEIKSDGIVEKLRGIGFTDDEAKEIRKIFLKCGLNNIDNAEPTDKNATIDGLVSFRVVMDDKRTAWFTVDKRKVFYIGLNGTDVYDTDKGGFLININDVHIPESEVSVAVFEKLRGMAETELDKYFIEAIYYDAWGAARQDDSYMMQCEVYANNKLGIKDWLTARVWFEYKDETYSVVGIVIDGKRYK